MQIISGKFKKQHLLQPKENKTRPTTSRVRESVFNILEHTVLENGFENLSCLDAFAGSGALGLEALSRGAKNCFFIEKDRSVFQILCQNYNKLAGDDYKKYCFNRNILNTYLNQKFDLIFLDPPFASIPLYKKTITHLNQKNMLHENTIFYIECSEKKDIRFNLLKITEKTYGSIKIMFFKNKIM